MSSSGAMDPGEKKFVAQSNINTGPVVCPDSCKKKNSSRRKVTFLECESKEDTVNRVNHVHSQLDLFMLNLCPRNQNNAIF